MSRQEHPLRKLNAAGQSVWCDHIHRGMIESGGLAAMIEDDDLRGITSNPSIFDKAIAGSNEYDSLLQRELRVRPGQSSRELFFTLTSKDICDGADVLRPVYDATGGVDGMISLEVSPDLANDTAGTIREARELQARLDRPNVMIKVPATRAGLPAIEELIASGMNINVTLLFAVDRYQAVAEAYLRGLERRAEAGQPVARIASVASFFVSRVDAALDSLLADKRPDLQGKIAIANAKLAYARFQQIFGGARFAPLKARGALTQRLLWASTSTKNPDYPDLLYCEALIGGDTVNTMPPATYEAFREAGKVAYTLEQDVASAKTQVDALASLGIDFKGITSSKQTASMFSSRPSTIFFAIWNPRPRSLPRSATLPKARPCPRSRISSRPFSRH
jgi:transaldolase